MSRAYIALSARLVDLRYPYDRPSVLEANDRRLPDLSLELSRLERRWNWRYSRVYSPARLLERGAPDRWGLMPSGSHRFIHPPGRIYNEPCLPISESGSSVNVEAESKNPSSPLSLCGSVSGMAHEGTRSFSTYEPTGDPRPWRSGRLDLQPNATIIVALRSVPVINA